MSIVLLLILFTLAITLSNVFNRLMPAIPLPLIQILLGVLMGLTSIGAQITFEPEIFLVMIIAPLLFREGEKADVRSILKHFSVILFLAFIGVFLTLFAVGSVLRWLLPGLPLAAYYAFGAALGPTDAVAVGSLSSRIRLPKHVTHILEGEGLLNDASGVTAFQFALAALTTGAFSWSNAAGTLVISSIGGGLVGWLLVLVKRKVVSWIEKASARDVTGYLLLELLLPFMAYLLAELFHVSGIIAAVLAGVMQAAQIKKTTLFDAQLATVSTTTWDTVTFTLNALVFLFLGIEISQVFQPIWESTEYSNGWLLLVILIVTAVLFAVRFLAVILYYFFKNHRIGNLREILLLTFGGVKGTVSLATVFILPLTLHGETFVGRSLLLFITAGVILGTLLVGIIVLPLLSEAEEPEPLQIEEIHILEEVAVTLQREADETNRLSAESVAENYRDRIREVYSERLTISGRKEVQELQLLMVAIERDGLDKAYESGAISDVGYQIYQRIIQRFERSITKQLLSIIGFWIVFVRRLLGLVLHPKRIFEKKRPQVDKDSTYQEIATLFHRNTQVVLQSYENLRDVYDPMIIDFLLEDRKAMDEQINNGLFVQALFAQQDQDYTKEVLRGYYLERKLIDEYEVDARITPLQASRYRQNVNLLESYSLNTVNDVPLVSLRRLTK
ncbi:Na+/H+ antiporter [Enterococcus canis]|uniref:Na+/H+ antiporter n=1 Tax=Enterococcus canis TaxID=214095 RepID=A0A1L8RFL2_9ENTE|nr:sodium:proton antiporter [Enterococcus canis]OJG18482.1 Na+/H+ antiporter [Enterococcus canis]